MASTKQIRAAKRNIKSAQGAARALHGYGIVKQIGQRFACAIYR